MPFRSVAHFGRRLSIRQRLSAIVVAFMIPLVTLAGIVTYEKSRDIDFSQKELLGLELLDHLVPTLQALIILQMDLSLHHNNQAHDHGPFEHAVDQADQAIKDYITAHAQLAGRLPIDQDGLAFWRRPHLTTKDLLAKWNDVQSALKAEDSQAINQALAQHKGLVDLVAEHINHLNDASNLLLDMNMDSVYLMENVSYELPEMLQHIHEANDAVIKLTRLQSDDILGSEEQNEILETIEKYIPLLIDSDLDVIKSNNEYALFGDPIFYGVIPGLKTRLEHQDGILEKTTRAYTNRLYQFYKNQKIDDLDGYIADALALQEAIDAVWWEQRTDLETMIQTRVVAYWQSIALYLVLCLAASALGLVVFFALVRSVTQPLATLEESMEKLAQGQLDIAIPEQDRQDEIGVMARTVAVFKQNAQTLDRLSVTFRDQVVLIYQQVFNSIQETTVAAESMYLTAERNQNLAKDLGLTVAAATHGLETAAAASQEMHRTTESIDAQLDTTGIIIDRCTTNAAQANSYMDRLREATASAATELEQIRKITDMTKLLSLNASIEAVKAGAAGKGFTVVADEVKVLANQAAEVSKDITEKIAQIQNLTNDYFNVMQTVSGSIGDMATVNHEITQALREQKSATGDIARYMDDIAKHTQSLEAAVSGITNSTGLTQDIAGEVENIVKNLAAVSLELEMALNDFRGNLDGNKP
jgi:methyl-accepting chemotaxis protein